MAVPARSAQVRTHPPADELPLAPHEFVASSAPSCIHFPEGRHAAAPMVTHHGQSGTPTPNGEGLVDSAPWPRCPGPQEPSFSIDFAGGLELTFSPESGLVTHAPK